MQNLILVGWLTSYLFHFSGLNLVKCGFLLAIRPCLLMKFFDAQRTDVSPRVFEVFSFLYDWWPLCLLIRSHLSWSTHHFVGQLLILQCFGQTQNWHEISSVFFFLQPKFICQMMYLPYFLLVEPRSVCWTSQFPRFPKCFASIFPSKRDQVW